MAPGAPRTHQQLLQALRRLTHDDKPQSHWASGTLSVDFKVISCEVSLKYPTQNSKQKQYYCTFLVPIDCLWLVYKVPLVRRHFFEKILKLYWTAWRVRACYSNAARTAQREHTAMKLKPNNQTPHA
jgi:hypothetical protein